MIVETEQQRADFLGVTLVAEAADRRNRPCRRLTFTIARSPEMSPDHCFATTPSVAPAPRLFDSHSAPRRDRACPAKRELGVFSFATAARAPCGVSRAAHPRGSRHQAPSKHVKQDDARRRLRRELLHAACSRMQPQLQGSRNREPVDLDHQLAIDDAARDRRRATQRNHFRKVTTERLAGFRAQYRRSSPSLKTEATEAVPLRLEPPVVALGQVPSRRAIPRREIERSTRRDPPPTFRRRTFFLRMCLECLPANAGCTFVSFAGAASMAVRPPEPDREEQT